MAIIAISVNTILRWLGGVVGSVDAGLVGGALVGDFFFPNGPLPSESYKLIMGPESSKN